MSQQKAKVKFILGLVLIICGWVICFNLFMLIIGIPFFLFGTILVMLSDKSLLVKVITIGVPIILWWVGFELILYKIKQKTPVAIIVPQQYKGQVRVVYGEKGGVIPKEVDGRMELEIPENGILIIQPHLESGLDDISYYYKDLNGVRYGMNQLKNASDKTIKRPAVYFEGTASSASENSEIAPALDYLYDSFYVLKNDSDRVETQVEEMKNNALTDSLVKVSRQLK